MGNRSLPGSARRHILRIVIRHRVTYCLDEYSYSPRSRTALAARTVQLLAVSSTCGAKGRKGMCGCYFILIKSFSVYDACEWDSLIPNVFTRHTCRASFPLPRFGIEKLSFVRPTENARGRCIWLARMLPQVSGSLLRTDCLQEEWQGRWRHAGRIERRSRRTAIG